MSNILILLLLISFSSCSDSQNVVTQDSAVSVLPGGSVGLSCSLTGGSVTGDNYPNWIHQTTGSIPKLVVGSWGTGNQNYRPSWTPERFTGAITGGKAVLSISRAQAEDDGVYYCVLWTGSAWIFGGGTQLTVITGDVKAPSVSIFAPSEEEIATKKATVVCSLSDFTPRGATVKWLVDGKEQTDSVQSSGLSKQSDNLYMESSYLSLTADQWLRHETYSCKVSHQGKEIIQTLKRSECV
ncbi:Ig lambda-1 chain V regions MOPC 104E/RPC20/J558/S104 isoform X1 [Xenopus laevis]|uniref:Ig lambda-1 chain V regions MOPC 104E/RPC20/J558/S104 isoform X1 n=1 Tax=Xenopus laevis TaxID=8355 RepID=A0A8J1KZU3_XENLA|nr:Ig lambda-1 chain V regions MOPC 104E/RPC20/J558/S104 isoform X1 [Xenopus laevis]